MLPYLGSSQLTRLRLLLVRGSHLEEQDSIRELPCGNPCSFKLRGNEVTRAPFFQLFFFFLSQIQLDFVWSVSIAHCCGESVLSLIAVVSLCCL